MEQKIWNLLKEKDTTLVADELMKLWDQPQTTVEDKNTIVHFLIHAGFHSTLKNQMLEDLSKGKPISWQGVFFFITTLSQLNACSDSVYIGLSETMELQSLFHFKFLQQLSLSTNSEDKASKLKNIRETLVQEKLKKNTQEQDQLIQRLKSAVNDKNQHEIKRLSEELQRRFSFNEEVRDLTSDIEVSNTRKILKKKEKEKLESKQFIHHESRSHEFKELSHSYLQQAQKDSIQAYYIAISLMQMESFQDALAALELAPANDAKDWLKLELLFLNKKFIETLDFSFQLELKYSHKPEVIYDTLYYRSISYYALNEKEKAKNILEKIIETKPEHIKSRIKLSEWKDSI